MKIGLFGGSFNPVHSTHIDVAKAVMNRLGLDMVLLVPAGNPYHKGLEQMLSAEMRYELTLEAVRDEEGLEASDIDMLAEGPTYTVRTLTEAARRYPDAQLFFMMGQDAFESFDKWKDWQKIPQLANIVAVSRAGSDHGEMAERLKKIFQRVEATGENVWKIEGGKSVYIIGDFDFVISSTLVREAWEKGEDISKYVPQAVADYIVKHNEEIKRNWTGA
ncbi:nicotinate-nucleotide adenylyltransferase [Maridesulfovibrio hydrothermalis]|uniref:Probable nicotinate-nucleotide adenylyltransferase n=1 Tax=Maridesulfovibrio hydrothermalis AM13 = DSM 14728 TaxID=1121451 RepID=L0R5Y0_9BACT|nr:nicotinate-nucleotide adenylyltransferase [Maridesulfovibrio hydrothermalis]CCO22079.1 putative nicotinate-nucleotide adenylyltransferase [Maridesulfovibrio hydrothermalis AM13 = DSM 14728]